MQNILSPEEFTLFDFDVSRQIDSIKIKNAIAKAERFLVIRSVGKKAHNDLALNVDGTFDEILNGVDSFTGLKYGIGLITFGFLMISNIKVTRMGAVNKDHQFSKKAIFEDAEKEAYSLFIQGTEILRESFLHMKEDKGIDFETLPYYSYMKGFYFNKFKI